MEEPGRLQSMGTLRVRHNWVTSLSLFIFMHWRRTWQPTPVFLPGESHGQRSLVGCSPWGRTESDTTEATWQQQQQNIFRVCCCSVSKSCLTLCDPMNCSMPGIPVLHYTLNLLGLMLFESVMPSNHLVLYRPLLLLPSNFPSIRVFSSESAVGIRWPEYWSFSFSISPSSEYSGLISFRMDWFDLLAVQRTLNSLLQNHSSKASILQCSIFFIVQLSHLYPTTGKMIAYMDLCWQSDVSAF